MKTVKTLNLTLVNAETVINNDANAYNPYEWKRTVERYQKYKNVEFFKVENETRYGKDEFLVRYTIEEGLTLIGHISYGACLHNGGFYRILMGMTNDNFVDMFDYLQTNGSFDGYEVKKDKFIMQVIEFGNGDKTGPAQNNKENRKIFAENNTTVTNNSFIFLK